ncbi:outer membrane MltA-interaction protein MipA [Shewanella sp. NFH-SH190041]|uniref:MipA/OmpV family protein n=1 Tax=Shewanella sp. NFH-SH190041 TaxID=2950245 RepID=UPI0021C47484|nr:MipA/OmpV family protein [Shewanella sp. NFH-SH190041]BDM63406.1 outer membrane MltA-interaction protein MipA [Shewanella sp. NFH-SH190041]
MSKFIALVSGWLLAFQVMAAPASSGRTPATVPVGQWQLGIAAGWGEKSNPLYQFDDIPIYLIPSIAYYGERFFFDNGLLGYTLADQTHYSVNLMGSFSSDRAWFERWDPSNIFTGTGYQLSQPTQLPHPYHLPPETPLQIQSLEGRNFTYLGGIEGFFYTKAGNFRLALAHDLFKVHHGSEAQIKWFTNWQLRKLKVDLALALDWKSHEVVNYYYGVRPSENLYWSEHFHGRSTWNRSVELNFSYPLTEHLEMLLLGRYTRFGTGIANSPLLKQDYSHSLFVGAAYRF